MFDNQQDGSNGAPLGSTDQPTTTDNPTDAPSGEAPTISNHTDTSPLGGALSSGNDSGSDSGDASNDSKPGDADDEDLLDLKQQALQQLTPLVGHLDQTPEEKFRTTMMLIQASDNKDLLKEAFDAAQAITDDKTRAQALLDVINEINYFTQKSD